MARIITNYTTYDMAYYYADHKRLPRLCKEEERQLLASLAAPASLLAQQITSIKQRQLHRLCRHLDAVESQRSPG
jgi:hypothetical protein